MADASPAKREYFGQGANPTRPTLPEPPACDVSAAMKDVATYLASDLFARARLDDGGEPVHFLLGDLLRKGHGEPASQWAIHRHVLAEHLVVIDDDGCACVAPTDALWVWWRNTDAAPAESTTSTADPPAVRHSPDFRSVNWFGKTYSFGPNQAACVKVLLGAWQSGTPDVGGETLLQAADAETQRVDVVFRGSPAWRTLIVQGETKGSYRLADPSLAQPERPKRDARKKSART